VLRDPLQAPSYRYAGRVHRHEDVKQRSGVRPSVRLSVPDGEKSTHEENRRQRVASMSLTLVLRRGKPRRRGQPACVLALRPRVDIQGGSKK